MQQIIKQLNKLVDVVKLIDLTEDEHFEREILLIKLNPDQEQLEELAVKTRELAAHQLETRDGIITLELTNAGPKLNEAVEKLKPYHVIEVVRSGVVGISSGPAVLRL